VGTSAAASLSPCDQFETELMVGRRCTLKFKLTHVADVDDNNDGTNTTDEEEDEVEEEAGGGSSYESNASNGNNNYAQRRSTNTARVASRVSQNMDGSTACSIREAGRMSAM
jgi:hypothetical protein